MSNQNSYYIYYICFVSKSWKSKVLNYYIHTKSSKFYVIYVSKHARTKFLLHFMQVLGLKLVSLSWNSKVWTNYICPFSWSSLVIFSKHNKPNSFYTCGNDRALSFCFSEQEMIGIIRNCSFFSVECHHVTYYAPPAGSKSTTEVRGGAQHAAVD